MGIFNLRTVLTLLLKCANIVCSSNGISYLKNSLFKANTRRKAMKKVRIFTPAFNVAGSLAKILGEFADVELVLKAHGCKLEVLVINDNSTDETKLLLEGAIAKYAWLEVKHNEQNLGNTGNIVAGYQWGADSDAEIVGCMDADGEHSPYAIIRHLDMIANGQCDGIVGSIIFPEHDCVNHNDRNMMRFWGGMQSDMAGIDGRFYIQSPGYNLHQRHRVEKALDLFEGYKKFFSENSREEFPRWGFHGVMIHLISAGTGAHIKAAYLECFGSSPNRTAEKLILQSGAANLHGMLLAKFLPKKP